MKGSALGVGARPLAALVAAVELAARTADIERATSGAAGLGAAFDAASAALTLHLNPQSLIPYPESLIPNPSS